MWLWRRMDKIKWNGQTRHYQVSSNEEVLRKVRMKQNTEDMLTDAYRRHL